MNTQCPHCGLYTGETFAGSSQVEPHIEVRTLEPTYAELQAMLDAALKQLRTKCVELEESERHLEQAVRLRQECAERCERLEAERLPINEGEHIEMVELWTGKCAARVRQPLTGKHGEWVEALTL